MNTSYESLSEKIASFLKVNAEIMLAPDYVNEGEMYFLRMPNQLAIVVSIEDDDVLEASVRVRNSSNWPDDWYYVDEGSFCTIESIFDIDSIVDYFMDYIKTEDERVEIADKITDIMFSENLTEFSSEKEDGKRLTIYYNLRDMAYKIVDECDENVSYNIEIDRLKELYEDLKESENW